MVELGPGAPLGNRIETRGLRYRSARPARAHTAPYEKEQRKKRERERERERDAEVSECRGPGSCGTRFIGARLLRQRTRKVDFIKRIYGSIVLAWANKSSGNGVLIKPDSGEQEQAAWEQPTKGLNIQHTGGGGG